MAPYCTPAQAAGLDTDVDQNDIQPEWVDWAEGQIDQWLERTYADEVEVTETLDGSGDGLLLLMYRPVTEVSAVAIGSTGIGSGSYAWYTSGYLRMKPWPPALGWPTPVWPIGRQNISVTYKYGLASGQTLPAKVQFCAAQLVCLMAKHSKQGLLGSSGEKWTIGGVSLAREGERGSLMEKARGIMEEALGARPPALF